MSRLLRSKSLFRNGAILVSKPAGCTSSDVSKWIKQTLYFEDPAIQRGELFVETVPLYSEWFQTGIILTTFGVFSRPLASVRARWTHEYIVGGVLGKQTQDYHIDSNVVKERPFDFVTRNILEYSLSHFVGKEVTQDNPPMLANLQRIENLKRYDPAKYEECLLNGIDFNEEEIDNDESIYEPELFFEGKFKKDFKGKLRRCNSIQLIDYKKPYFTLRVNCDGLFSCRDFVKKLGDHLGCCATITSLHLQSGGPFHHDRDPILQKHEIHLEQMGDNLQKTSPKCQRYLEYLKTITPMASSNYRYMW